MSELIINNSEDSSRQGQYRRHFVLDEELQHTIAKCGRTKEYIHTYSKMYEMVKIPMSVITAEGAT